MVVLENTLFCTCIVCHNLSLSGMDICSEACFLEYQEVLKELSKSSE